MAADIVKIPLDVLVTPDIGEQYVLTTDQKGRVVRASPRRFGLNIGREIRTQRTYWTPDGQPCPEPARSILAAKRAAEKAANHPQPPPKTERDSP